MSAKQTSYLSISSINTNLGTMSGSFYSQTDPSFYPSVSGISEASFQCPEPLTLLGCSAAIIFGTAFKRKQKQQ